MKLKHFLKKVYQWYESLTSTDGEELPQEIWKNAVKDYDTAVSEEPTISIIIPDSYHSHKMEHFKIPLNGEEIMDLLQISSGQEVQKAKNFLKQLVVEGKINSYDRYAAKAYLLRNFKK